MNLIIDIGNTLIKTAIFQNGELKDFSAFETIAVDDLKKIVANHKEIKNAILSSVTNHNTTLNEFLK